MCYIHKLDLNLVLLKGEIMFKFIIIMAVMMFSVPAMAQQDFKRIELAGTGMTYAVPVEWKEGRLLGTVTWSDQGGASKLHSNVNWQIIPLAEGETVTEAELLKGLEILQTQDLQIEETAPKDFSLSYTVEKGESTILFTQRAVVVRDACLVGTLTCLKSQEDQAKLLWKHMKELTPTAAGSEPKDIISIEIQIEDLKDVIQTKENKLQRLELIDRSADRAVRESLTDELEVLGLKFRKLERLRDRNIREAFRVKIEQGGKLPAFLR